MFGQDYEFDQDHVDQLRRELTSVPCAVFKRRGVCLDKHCVFGHKKGPEVRDVIMSSNLPSEDGMQQPTSPHWEPSSPIRGSSSSLIGGTPQWEPSSLIRGPSSPQWEPSSPIRGPSLIGGPSSPVWKPSDRDNYLGASSTVRCPHPPSDEARLQGAISPMELGDIDNRYEAEVSLFAEDVASRFFPLLNTLRDLLTKGNGTPLRSMVGERLARHGTYLYRLSGVTTFKAYAELAAKAGLIDLIPPSNGPGTERMSLRESFSRK